MIAHAAAVPLTVRPRRLRSGPAVRALTREHAIRVDALVQPLFVCDPGVPIGEIPSMPGVFRFTSESVVAEAREIAALGIRAVLLFGLPARKDATASSAADADGVVQRAIRAIKAAVPELLVIADLCNCEYTDHGHCGVLDARGEVDNDATLALLARTARSYAEAGVDVVAPSDMMDGRIGYLRAALDADGRERVALMSYAVKYASAFYGPFRDAADSAPQSGDRRGYQMDPANVREAVREALLDVAEGADFLIVKPAMAYLDVVRAVRERVELPIAVYNVSGEYAMVKAAARNGWIDEARTVDELMTSFVRAGADVVITYFAKDVARRLGGVLR